MHVRVVGIAVALSACDWIITIEPRPKWVSISAGASHTCGIQDDDRLYCWGKNNNGQLGDSTLLDRTTPIEPDDEMRWRMVSTSVDSTCAIAIDRSLWCWGDNVFGQLGQGNRLTIPRPLQVGADFDWRVISIGRQHTCGIRSDDSMWCWGGDSQRALGNGMRSDELVPQPIADVGVGWAHVATGNRHTCAIATDKTLWCWGTNATNQLGIPGVMNADVPRQVGSDADWIAVTSSSTVTVQGDSDVAHVCALREGGAAFCWGTNLNGQAGAPFIGSLSEPTQIAGMYTSIAAGGEHTCGIDAARTLSCWGRNERGQLGTGVESGESHSDGQIVSGEWVAVATGDSHTCAIDRDGQAWCTGTRSRGELGDGGELGASPRLVGSGYVAVDVGFQHVCALRNGGIECWGRNRSGQLADASRAPRQVPSVIPSTMPARVAAGFEQSCSLEGTTVRCWGFPLGNNTSTKSATPTLLETPTSRPWRAIGMGQHSCAIATNNELLCWGPNTVGQCGDGTTTLRLEPRLVSGGPLPNSYSQVAPSRDFTCAIHTTGVVACWGANGAGQLGDGTIAQRLSPTPVEVSQLDQTPFMAKLVTTGGTHACAITTAGQLYCWGSNARGQLGNGITEGARNPSLAGDGWSHVSAGERHTCAVGADATLYCWGANHSGQLGDATYIDRALPTNIMGDVATVSVRGDTSCAITVGGDLYCWGLNDFGQLGAGTAWRSTFGLVAKTD